MSEGFNIATVPYYYVVSKASGMALDVTAEKARLFFPLNTPLQQWYFEDRGNGYVSIVNRGTHQVLDVDMAGTENGSQVHVWNDVNADNQLWRLEPTDTEEFRIRAKTSGRYLDIIRQSLGAEASLHIWDGTKTDTQVWIVKKVQSEQEAVEVTPAASEEAPKPRRKRRTAEEMAADAAEKAASPDEKKGKALKGLKPGRKRSTAAPKSRKPATEKQPAEAVPAVQMQAEETKIELPAAEA